MFFRTPEDAARLWFGTTLFSSPEERWQALQGMETAAKDEATGRWYTTEALHDAAEKKRVDTKIFIMPVGEFKPDYERYSGRVKDKMQALTAYHRSDAAVKGHAHVAGVTLGHEKLALMNASLSQL